MSKSDLCTPCGPIGGGDVNQMYCGPIGGCIKVQYQVAWFCGPDGGNLNIMGIEPLIHQTSNSSSLLSIELHRSTPRSIRRFCFKQRKFLASFEGSTHVSVIQARSRTTQNTVFIKENCLDDLQRGIIAGQETRLGTSHTSAFRSSAEEPLAKQANEETTGNSRQNKAEIGSAETPTSSTPASTKKRRKHLCATV
ncbi:hypothetical protein BGZ94_000816 [Podila epigama]|nr:hypothetical protein BGZ94_000816 [Podila epigama]